MARMAASECRIDDEACTLQRDTPLIPKERHLHAALNFRERRIARALTSVLRHGRPADPGIGNDGYLDISRLLELKNFAACSFDAELCLRIVAQDKKNRFSMIRRGTAILVRANQGHSLSKVRDEKLLVRIDAPEDLPVIIHGSYLKAWPLIVTSGGLSRMARNHVHFTTGLPQNAGVISGMSGAAEIAIFVNASKAMGLGIQFYRSSNGVILTPSTVPVSCFEKVLRLKDSGIHLHFTPRISGLVDSHVHLTCEEMQNPWAASLPIVPPAPDGWSEDRLLTDCRESSIDIAAFVFVECCNESPMDEALWAISMAKSARSKCASVVAHIPVPDGPGAVVEFLSVLRRSHGGKLPREVSGGRVVLLGESIPDPSIIASQQFMAGLRLLGENGLHWEWCVHYSALAYVVSVCRALRNMTFVLDHCGRNMGTPSDFEGWKQALAAFDGVENVYVKLGAVEEWNAKDGNPLPYMEHAIRVFGYKKCLFESNWFVARGMGAKRAYGRTANDIMVALDRCGAFSSGSSYEEVVGAVFRDNARRIYRIS